MGICQKRTMDILHLLCLAFFVSSFASPLIQYVTTKIKHWLLVRKHFAGQNLVKNREYFSFSDLVIPNSRLASDQWFSLVSYAIVCRWTPVSNIVPQMHLFRMLKSPVWLFSGFIGLFMTSSKATYHFAQTSSIADFLNSFLVFC